jgi:pyruvate dehydrogenase E1 component
MGATAGRTTLAGEGLQHQDGNSHVLATVVPNLRAYDPAFAYELAVIVEDGIQRMYRDRESVFYYLTIMNEAYRQEPMPEGSEEGILRGLYKVRPAPAIEGPRIHLFGSGAILRSALAAQDLLAEFGVGAAVWSATSYGELRRDALSAERWNMLHPTEPARISWIEKALHPEPWPIVAATDYSRALPAAIAPYVPDGLHPLGTDGFGRSDDRASLRRFFEVDAESIAIAALYQLGRREEVDPELVSQAIAALGVDPEKPDPARQ